MAVAIGTLPPASSWGRWPWGGQQRFTCPAPPCSQTEILSLSPLCLARPSSSSRPASGLLRPTMPGRRRVTRRCAQAPTGHAQGRTSGLIFFYFAPPIGLSPFTVPPLGPRRSSCHSGSPQSCPGRVPHSSAFVSAPDLPRQCRAMRGAFSTAAVRAGAQGPARTKRSVFVTIAEKQELKNKNKKKCCSSAKVLSASARGRIPVCRDKDLCSRST